MIQFIAAALMAWLITPAAVSASDCQPSPSGALVNQWSGTGDRNTEPFVATGDPMKLTYTTSSPYGHPQLCWRIRGTDGKLGPGGCAQQEAGETFVYLSPGSYWLELKPSGDFSVTLEQT